VNGLSDRVNRAYKRLIWLGTWVLWKLRYLWWWLGEATFQSLDTDLRTFNRELGFKAEQLTQQWDEGHGTAPEEATIGALSDVELRLAWDVAREELTREIDRRSGLTGRSGAVATAASVVLVVVLYALQSGEQSTARGMPGFPEAAASFLVVQGCFFILTALASASLAASVFRCLEVMVSGAIWLPSFSSQFGREGEHRETAPARQEHSWCIRLLMSLLPAYGLAIQSKHMGVAVRRRALRSILYAIELNRIETLKRTNTMDSAVRHLRAAFWCLLGTLLARIAPDLMRMLLALL
jgi:hypothetical protein